MFYIIHDLYFYFFFFFNDTATTEIYTLSLHDALPICNYFSRKSGKEYFRSKGCLNFRNLLSAIYRFLNCVCRKQFLNHRSEEHTSELQSLAYLVCRLLLEKKKKQPT